MKHIFMILRWQEATFSIHKKTYKVKRTFMIWNRQSKIINRNILFNFNQLQKTLWTKKFFQSLQPFRIRGLSKSQEAELQKKTFFIF